MANALYHEFLHTAVSYLEALRREGIKELPISNAVIGVARPNQQSKAHPSAQVVTNELTEKKGAASEKLEALNQLRERALECQKCSHLASSRTQVVFGTGDPNARLMFIGEAPGADEDAQGEPFVGRAGQLLTKIIQAMGLSRETVYIANILKCRPDTPGQSSGNRKPEPAEMQTCLPYLLAQIDIIKPDAIVALGATAVEGLFGQPAPITKIRGIFRTIRGIPVMPTYHPSYLLRNQALSVKREVWEDMLKVMELLQMPVSEKQRGYFLAT